MRFDTKSLLIFCELYLVGLRELGGYFMLEDRMRTVIFIAKLG